MSNKSLDQELVKRMYDNIRITENKNIKNSHAQDDKTMIRRLEKYINERVLEEMNNEN